MLVNVIVGHCGLNKEVNFFNLNDFIPDIYISRHISKDLGFEPFPRIIKSHGDYNPLYKKAIWLIRDPRNVMVSFWHYTNDFMNGNKPISEFIKDKRTGINAWIKHSESWLQAPLLTKIKLVRYEDLRTNTKKELFDILNYLGIPVSEEVINMAVKKSSLENMRRLEKETWGVKRQLVNFKFVRSGKVNQSELKPSDEDYINQKAEKLMKYFRYL